MNEDLRERVIKSLVSYDYDVFDYSQFAELMSSGFRGYENMGDGELMDLLEQNVDERDDDPTLLNEVRTEIATNQLIRSENAR
jgi:hypothetical protein